MKKNLPTIFLALVSCILLSSKGFAQQSVGLLDTVVVQKPLQNWMEEDGKDSLKSESFILRNGIIRSEMMNGKVIVLESDEVLIAPERKLPLQSQPKKDWKS